VQGTVVESCMGVEKKPSQKKIKYFFLSQKDFKFFTYRRKLYGGRKKPSQQKIKYFFPSQKDFKFFAYRKKRKVLGLQIDVAWSTFEKNGWALHSRKRLFVLFQAHITLSTTIFMPEKLSRHFGRVLVRAPLRPRRVTFRSATQPTGLTRRYREVYHSF
jgi:hypothetical protein